MSQNLLQPIGAEMPPGDLALRDLSKILGSSYAMHMPKLDAMSARSAFAKELLGLLWERYRSRQPYVGVYENLVREAGASFSNDHVAFRSFACQYPGSGMHSVSRVFEALGWQAAGAYSFPDKKLSALYFAPPAPELPRLFVSELRVWELSAQGREGLRRVTASQRPPVEDSVLANLRNPEELSEGQAAGLLAAVARHFLERPWDAPEEAVLRALDAESQYAAWVALFGHQVNHFTAAVHAHGAGPLSDIEKTVAALRGAGVPMKEAIEGEAGSPLRQCATEAAVVSVALREGSVDWPYAYFEIAERPLINGARFEGFLGPQAANLFAMTQRS